MAAHRIVRLLEAPGVLAGLWRLFIGGAFIVLLTVATVRLLVDGNWGAGAVALLIAVGLVWGEWRAYVRVRASVRAARRADSAIPPA